MELNIKFIPNHVNTYTVIRKVAEIVHSPKFMPQPENGRLMNFRVVLNDNPAGGVRNDGTGVLTFGEDHIASKFLKWVVDTPLRIDGKKLKFYRKGPPSKKDADLLKKTLFVDPSIEEERERINYGLRDMLRVDVIQFGVFYRNYPNSDAEKLEPRRYSIEWERSCIDRQTAWLRVEYDHRLMRIVCGDQLSESEGSSLVIPFSTIQKLGVGYDGRPYVCFDTLTPPIFETYPFHRTLTGTHKQDNYNFKHRLMCLDEGHRIVAPFATKLRILFVNEDGILQKFSEMCYSAGIAKQTIIQCMGPLHIEATKEGFFSEKRIRHLRNILSKFPWPIAFQLESLLRNGLLHSDEILSLLPKIQSLQENETSTYIGNLLRHYNEKLQIRPLRESPARCFDLALRSFKPIVHRGEFLCSHVTFTPTRVLLEGPFATQSNRIIRKYAGYEDHFMRVEFREEDRLNFRWEREVDAVPFLRARVGDILKNGFTLAGRFFEFLAYSNSALREHSVWFMNPFIYEDAVGRCVKVTASSIRDDLGVFKGDELGDKLLKIPSKYAARLAQAFTATDASVMIRREEWTDIDDLGKEPYLFTDGCGTLSFSLARKIWAKLCEMKHRPYIESSVPSAFQIRFLGYKGVISVDAFLEKERPGIHMCLRPSMKKFSVSKDAEQLAPIEIAQAFYAPNDCYLNRPLIMLLEDIGIPQPAFLELQNEVIKNIEKIDTSIDNFAALLGKYNLGNSFNLQDILRRLKRRYKFDLKPNSKDARLMDNPFWKHLREVVSASILRDIKHSARIYVPDSYLLVGVPDEGPAYEAAGFQNVFTLKAGEVFICIQRPGDEEPTFLSGLATISRSPVAFPGDVQRVRAIGKPPASMMCLFAHLKNVVVLPSEGNRSLASCLGGGDVDGDLFSVIFHKPLLPTSVDEPADYEPSGPKTLDRECHVEDICDFVVEYIHSDVLGLLSDRLLIIADQSAAVDYPKQGNPVSLDDDTLPKTLMRIKPDWHAAEVVSPRHTDYYESTKALGKLFRNIHVDENNPVLKSWSEEDLRHDPITEALRETIAQLLGHGVLHDGYPPETVDLYRQYSDELRYISATHALSDSVTGRLLESEIITGSILAKCTQKRHRKQRIYRMALHSGTLVGDIKSKLCEKPDSRDMQELLLGLEASWKAWNYAKSKVGRDNLGPSKLVHDNFGSYSFGLIALGVILEILDYIDKLESEN
ncbi:hypothetical protein CVT24_011512 [Panaeolus cyanescens]|uniref:RNA-dependent RNA polymerase n=1 Tax=Panaeolus cyanescens TaxID=181874 RepID=A0A409VMF6_9AGAR|nr:hypothetical protein CVT24_011512 [Panaeolus cyanescens]